MRICGGVYRNKAHVVEDTSKDHLGGYINLDLDLNSDLDRDLNIQGKNHSQECKT